MSLVQFVGKKDHFTINANENYYKSFSGCCKGGDILNYMQEIEGLTFIQAKEKLLKITNTAVSTKEIEAIKIKPKETKQNKNELEQIKNFVMQGWNKKEYNQELIDYLKTRGLGQNAIDKYHLFISKDKYNTKRLYIPLLNTAKEPIAYIGRAIDKQSQYKYINSRGGLPLFNSEYLSKEAEKGQNQIYITEGFFDAISIESEGKKAISLNSTQGQDKLIEYIKQHQEIAKTYLYILALDTDTAGQRATAELQNKLAQLDIKSAILEIPKEYKDINEWYSKVEHNQFKQDIEKNYFNKYDKKTNDYYIGTEFLEEIKKASRYQGKRTGFAYLDMQLNGGLKPYLYILGAIPSLRKNDTSIANSRQYSKSR